MSSHRVFNGVGDAVKQRLESYWEKKLPRLEKLLAPYPADLRKIRLTVSQHRRDSRPSWFEVRAVLRLPTGTLAAEANAEAPQVGLDRVADALVAEIKKHKERVRQDDLFKRKGRDRADLSTAGPLLERDVEHGRREDFDRLLRLHLRILRDHARRELRTLELEGLLHRGEVSPDDLLDQVLIEAWQRFADRPKQLPLDLWLVDLLDETLEQWIKQEPRPRVSLEQKARTDEGRPQDEQEWWKELLGETETFTLGDLIPDTEATPAWDELDSEEQRDRLVSLIRQLPRARRQAFLLHALENYSAAEVATLQDRPVGEVEADIEAARQTLRERLLAGEYLEAGKRADASGTAPEKSANVPAGSLHSSVQ